MPIRFQEIEDDQEPLHEFNILVQTPNGKGTQTIKTE